jgi:RNA recognition motif-containing protein
MDRTVCIDGLPRWFGAEDLKKLCGSYGKVVSARIVTDAHGLSLACGFVEMTTVEEAEQVIRALDGSDRFGALIYVARTYPLAWARCVA